MEELGFMWSYQEGIDEMKHQLLYASLELEAVRAEAKEEIRRNEENVASLLSLLEVAYHERDEARQQLQSLLNELKLKTLNPTLISPKPNSSITGSNSQSLNSSPVGSFFDPVSPPTDPTDMGFANQPFVQNRNGSMVVVKSDPFDDLAKGKKLPEKGRLLQAVLDAGPLLSNLLVSGPLPRWRNPPTMQALKFPPANQNLGGVNLSVGAKRAFDSGSYLEMSCGSSRVRPTTLGNLNFSADPRCNGRVFGSGIDMDNQIPLTKRQRFH